MRVLRLLLAASAFFAAPLTIAAEQAPTTPPSGSFTLWQLPPQTGTQMMSYVLRTCGGKTIVIDGGTAGDATYLRGFLAALGNRVDAWFITHPHSDHVDALTEILSRPQELQLRAIYASMPDEPWVVQCAQEPDEALTVHKFNQALEKARKSVDDLKLGRLLVFDTLNVEVLGIRNPEITVNALNNSSAVLKVWDGTKAVLFLGDLGLEGGQKLLRGPYREKLKADYVQMAHHGQRGVGKPVYEIIRPSACLWPTPRWLWENDAGRGKGSGPWRTLEVRAWMDELSIKRHYVSAEGLFRID